MQPQFAFGSQYWIHGTFELKTIQWYSQIFLKSSVDIYVENSILQKCIKKEKKAKMDVAERITIPSKHKLIA